MEKMEKPYEITEYDRRTKELLEEREMIWSAIKLLAKETDAYKSWKEKEIKEELKKKEDEHIALERELKMKEAEAHNNKVITEAIVRS